MHESCSCSPCSPAPGIINCSFAILCSDSSLWCSFIFLWWLLLTIFHVFTCHPFVFLNEVSAEIFCPFLTALVVSLLLSFESSLYIQAASSLMNMWFITIISQAVAWIFILNNVFYRVKYFNFDDTQYIIFPFFGQSFSIYLKTVCLTPDQNIFSYVFF